MNYFSVKLNGDIEGVAFEQEFKAKAKSSNEAMLWAQKQAEYLQIKNLVVRVDEFSEEFP